MVAWLAVRQQQQQKGLPVTPPQAPTCPRFCHLTMRESPVSLGSSRGCALRGHYPQAALPQSRASTSTTACNYN